MHSINVYTSSLVDKILINPPSEYVSEAFAHNAGCESSKVADNAVMFVYFLESLAYPLVMLCLIFVMKLEENSGTDNVKRVRDQAGHQIRCH